MEVMNHIITSLQIIVIITLTIALPIYGLLEIITSDIPEDK